MVLKGKITFQLDSLMYGWHVLLLLYILYLFQQISYLSDYGLLVIITFHINSRYNMDLLYYIFK